ncbi:MAG TPA: Gfo/Idh/MocA family oxidoreductase [Sedimentisphaerales bacterium]|nr:Gfo/Idh/MocA family oxidoreductase [Sedimentisphaerales bacterium]
MKKLGVGIIGCGAVAEEYVKAFKKDERSEIRALVSRNRGNAERYRDRYDLDCAIETDAAEMLRRKDTDIAVVCTPHNQHTKYAVAAAEAGKHIIIEKPVAITLEDMRKQQEAVKKAGVKTLVSFVLHWNPLLMIIDRLITQGVFGNIFMVEVDYMHRIWMTADQKWYASRQHSGTAILTGGCHAIDALRWFARSEVRQVCACQVKTENPIEYPGTISVNVEFEDGKIGRSTTTFDAQMPYRFNIGVYGTEGTIRNNKIFAPKLFPGQNDFMKIPCILPDSPDVAHHPFVGEVSHLLDCIIEDKQPYPDLEDAAQTHAVCFAADLSAESGRPVTISELDDRS